MVLRLLRLGNFTLFWRDPSWYWRKRGWFIGWWFYRQPYQLTVLGFNLQYWKF